MRGCTVKPRARRSGGVTKYEIESICSSGLCESPGPRCVPQGTPFGFSAHFAIPLASFAFSRRKRWEERERAKGERGGVLSSRYHKSFEVLICSHTRRLFRASHPPDLTPTWRFIRRPFRGLCPCDIPTLFVLLALLESQDLSAACK